MSLSSEMITQLEAYTGTLGDLNLRASTLEQGFITPVAVTATAAALPELQGAGMVRDLREVA